MPPLKRQSAIIIIQYKIEEKKISFHSIGTLSRLKQLNIIPQFSAFIYWNCIHCVQYTPKTISTLYPLRWIRIPFNKQKVDHISKYLLSPHTRHRSTYSIPISISYLLSRIFSFHNVVVVIPYCSPVTLPFVYYSPLPWAFQYYSLPQ